MFHQTLVWKRDTHLRHFREAQLWSPRGVNHTPTPIGSEMPITETNMVPNIGLLP
jgi:hypothetical protein